MTSRQKRVIDCVAADAKIPVKKLMGISRKQAYVLPRHICFFLLKSLFPISFQEIGDIFGKDHTTIMHGVKRIKDEMKNDKELAAIIERLLEALEQVVD